MSHCSYEINSNRYFAAEAHGSPDRRFVPCDGGLHTNIEFVKPI